MKEIKMIKIGDTLTTSVSGVTGRVAEIVPNDNGKTARVRLVVEEKWTTIPYRKPRKKK